MANISSLLPNLIVEDVDLSPNTIVLLFTNLHVVLNRRYDVFNDLLHLSQFDEVTESLRNVSCMRGSIVSFAVFIIVVVFRVVIFLPLLFFSQIKEDLLNP